MELLRIYFNAIRHCMWGKPWLTVKWLATGIIQLLTIPLLLLQTLPVHPAVHPRQVPLLTKHLRF